MRSTAFVVLLLVCWSTALVQAKKSAKTNKLPRLYEHVGEWSVLQAKKGLTDINTHETWQVTGGAGPYLGISGQVVNTQVSATPNVWTHDFTLV